MQATHRRCCGIDVHKKKLSVCVLPPVGSTGVAVREETFRTFTRDLKRLRKWLLNCRVTEIVMESTGQYWRPVWNILSEAFEKLLLVNPLHVKALKGRKTDRMDAQWLATRLEKDDLKGSFIPPREIEELRELTRLRVHWLEDLNRVKNRISQVCEAGNIKVSSVASDLFGESGRRMLKALVEGKRDPGWMADSACGKLRGKKAELELALEGTFTIHRRLLLGRLLRQMQNLEEEVASVTAVIAERVEPHRELIERLSTIPGIDRISAWTVLAEIGLDMSVFGDSKHLASWAGLCPGNRESGGKRISGKTRKGNRYLRRALCQSAWAASHKKDSHLSVFYRRIRNKRGEQKAIMALAHRLVVIAFHIIRDGSVYRELGATYYERKNKPKVTRRLVERLTRLGYYVTLEPVEPEIPEVVEEAVPVPEAAPARRRGRPCKCAERGIPCQHNRTLAPETNTREMTPDTQGQEIVTP